MAPPSYAASWVQSGVNLNTPNPSLSDAAALEGKAGAQGFDRSLNVGDFICFMNRYAAGCP